MPCYYSVNQPELEANEHPLTPRPRDNKYRFPAKQDVELKPLSTTGVSSRLNPNLYQTVQYVHRQHRGK